MTEALRIAFIKAATWHGSLEEANLLLTEHPGLAACDIHTAAITGNVSAIDAFLAGQPEIIADVSEPYGANALVHLCLSKYLRLAKERSDDFLAAATRLLDAGADPNSGFWSKESNPEWETALYGAAGVAHHAALTQLLIDRGADPNDPDTVYHSPEGYENDAMKVLVETGKLTPDDLLLMLIRKHDWHDLDGVNYLLQHGANPNGARSGDLYPLHHALMRSNRLAIITALIDKGADPYLVKDNITALARAVREGRSDVLALLTQKGIPVKVEGVDQLIAACAQGNQEVVKVILKESPVLLSELTAMGGELLARFCLNDNRIGVQQLLDLGIDVNTPYTSGDPYFGIPAGSLPIHVAAWMGHSSIVALLIERGSVIDKADGNGYTPLSLAVKACIDSYWAWRRSPDSVRALLEAGASTKNVSFPIGYKEVDDLLEAYGHI